MDTQHRQWPRRLAGAIGVLLLGTVAAACSSGTAPRQVASLSGHGTANNTTSNMTVGQSNRDVVNFARCLRAHGVSEADPAPRPGHAVAVQIPAPTPANRAALAACNHFIAKDVAAKMAHASQQLAQWLPSLVRYAACMRRHDIPMLDPGSLGQLNLGNVPGITSDFGRYSPQFRAADAACRHLLPTGVRDNGTGP
jgi:hypothetical protein